MANGFRLFSTDSLINHTVNTLPHNARRWFTVFLLPFQVYLPAAIIWVIAWKYLTQGLYNDKWLFIEKVRLAVLGYGICLLAFLVASAIQFAMCIVARRRYPLDWDRGLKTSLCWGAAALVLMVIFEMLIPHAK